MAVSGIHHCTYARNLVAAMKTTYVAGFMFDQSRLHVALIRKNKPKWQAGKLNGIGGKVEAEESILHAMVREFSEETSTTTTESQWNHFLTMRGGDWIVEFLFTTGDVWSLQSPEEEKVEIVDLGLITPLREDMIENLPWLISMALDCAMDGRPDFASVIYPS